MTRCMRNIRRGLRAQLRGVRAPTDGESGADPRRATRWAATQEEQRALEAKYRELYAPLYATRASIVSGATDIEHPAGEAPDQPAGVPEFWLTALRNNEMLEEQARAAALQVVLIGCLIALMLVLRPKGIWGEKLK